MRPRALVGCTYEKRAALRCPDHQHHHRYRGGVAANEPSPAIRVASEVPKLDSEDLLDSGVFGKKTPIEHNEKDGARTPPRAPNFNVHIHAQAAVYKTGRLFGNGSHSLRQIGLGGVPKKLTTRDALEN